MASLPIRFSELVQLTSLGIDGSAIGFNSCVSPFPRALDPAVSSAAEPSYVALSPAASYSHGRN